VAAGACFALLFLAESAETFVLLRLLGAEMGFAQVMAVEPLVSLLRALAFFVPAGLGVQDLGYVALLRLVGVPRAAAVGAGFVLLKRMKELVWTTVGWSVLLRAEAREPAREATGEREEAADPVHLRVDEPDHADAPDRARAVGA